MTDRVMVRGVTSDAECVAACEVAAAVLTERVRAAGISQKAWAWLEGQKLLRSKPLWDHYGEEFLSI